MIRTPADVGIEAARADDNARASRILLIPSALTEWRERLGYSQREAALVIGCSRGAWAGWESGTNPIPHYIGLAMAAIALGVQPYGGAR